MGLTEESDLVASLAVTSRRGTFAYLLAGLSFKAYLDSSSLSGTGFFMFRALRSDRSLDLTCRRPDVHAASGHRGNNNPYSDLTHFYISSLLVRGQLGSLGFKSLRIGCYSSSMLSIESLLLLPVSYNRSRTPYSWSQPCLSLVRAYRAPLECPWLSSTYNPYVFQSDHAYLPWLENTDVFHPHINVKKPRLQSFKLLYVRYLLFYFFYLLIFPIFYVLSNSDTDQASCALTSMLCFTCHYAFITARYARSNQSFCSTSSKYNRLSNAWTAGGCPFHATFLWCRLRLLYYEHIYRLPVAKIYRSLRP